MQSIGSKIFIVIILAAFLASGADIGQLLDQAMQSHPAIEAQRAAAKQAFEQYREILEFLDPTLYAAGGYGSQLRGLPLVPAGYSRVGAEDSLEAQAGVLVPIAQGAYLSAGGVTRRWFHPNDYRDPFYQHLLGVNLQIPLWRDRGFALLGFRERVALAGYWAVMERLHATAQEVQHAIEQAYITACSSRNAYQITQGATKRFERLNTEARELADLKTIPEYQYTETVRDLQNGREDEEIARNAWVIAQVALAAAVGVDEPISELDMTYEEFLKAVADATLPDFSFTAEDALETRGEPRALRSEREQAQAQYEQSTPSITPSLTVFSGVGNMTALDRNG